jgi:riboflavin biosynthesis pyrimidine reductase
MSATSDAATLGLLPLELLYEEPGLPDFDVPEALAVAYGGSIGFATPRLYANVTTSLDGAFESAGPFQPSESAGPHLKFLTGLLRSCADAVVVGGDVGTGRPDVCLSAEDAYPPAAPAYARLRRLRGCSPRPRPVVLFSGDGPGRTPPELVAGTLVLASERCARSLRERLPASTALIELTESSTQPHEVVDALRGRGYELILCEGCPAFVGAFLRAGAVDEIFLTHAPLLAGRTGPGSQNGLGSLLLDRVVSARLLSLRRAGSYIFSRYELDRGGASGRP